MKIPGTSNHPSGSSADDPEKRQFSGWADLALQTSMTLAVSVGVGFFAGHWLDQQLHTSPWLMILLTLWGVGGGTTWLILRVKRYSEYLESQSKQEK